MLMLMYLQKAAIVGIVPTQLIPFIIHVNRPITTSERARGTSCVRLPRLTFGLLMTLR
jgi:hypothetical protein